MDARSPFADGLAHNVKVGFSAHYGSDGPHPYGFDSGSAIVSVAAGGTANISNIRSVDDSGSNVDIAFTVSVSDTGVVSLSRTSGSFGGSSVTYGVGVEIESPAAGDQLELNATVWSTSSGYGPVTDEIENKYGPIVVGTYTGMFTAYNFAPAVSAGNPILQFSPLVEVITTADNAAAVAPYNGLGETHSRIIVPVVTSAGDVVQPDSLRIVLPPTNGGAVVSGTSLVYTSDALNTSNDSFEYGATYNGSEGVGTISIIIAPSPPAPVAAKMWTDMVGCSETVPGAESGVAFFEAVSGTGLFFTLPAGVTDAVLTSAGVYYGGQCSDPQPTFNVLVASTAMQPLIYLADGFIGVPGPVFVFPLNGHINLLDLLTGSEGECFQISKFLITDAKTSRDYICESPIPWGCCT